MSDDDDFTSLDALSCTAEGCKQMPVYGGKCSSHASLTIADTTDGLTAKTTPPADAPRPDRARLPTCDEHSEYNVYCTVCVTHVLADSSVDDAAPVRALPPHYWRQIDPTQLTLRDWETDADADGRLTVRVTYAHPNPTGGRTTVTAEWDGGTEPVIAIEQEASDPIHALRADADSTRTRAEPPTVAAVPDGGEEADLSQWTDTGEPDPLVERENPLRNPATDSIIGFVGKAIERECLVYTTSPLRDYHYCSYTETNYGPQENQVYEGFVIPEPIIDRLQRFDSSLGEVSRIFVHDATDEEYPAPDGNVIEYPARAYFDGCRVPDAWHADRPGDDGDMRVIAPDPDVEPLAIHEALGSDLYKRSFEDALDYIAEKRPGRLSRD